MPKQRCEPVRGSRVLPESGRSTVVKGGKAPRCGLSTDGVSRAAEVGCDPRSTSRLSSSSIDLTRRWLYRAGMDRRRFLVTSLAGVLAAPPAAGAQQAGRIYRVGYLSPTPPSQGLAVFVRRLKELGYEEGRNLLIEARSADGRDERYPALAAEIIARGPDVIVAYGNTAAVPAKRATVTIPIVMVGGIDPVGAGLAESLARPGGNVTGILQDVGQGVVVKQLQLLRELVPSASRVAIIMGPHQTSTEALPHLKAGADALNLTLQPIRIKDSDDIESAFATIMRERADALLVLSNPIITDRPKAVVELAARNRIPTAYWWTGMVVRFGGLMSYGVDWTDLLRRAATYVDMIFKGAKPADLPIQQPTRFELVINLRTAKALGLTIPPSLLARADQVIE
jgi:putative tryptophan/tyrosine transport system substrate-binding protein